MLCTEKSSVKLSTNIWFFEIALNVCSNCGAKHNANAELSWMLSRTCRFRRQMNTFVYSIWNNTFVWMDFVCVCALFRFSEHLNSWEWKTCAEIIWGFIVMPNSSIFGPIKWYARSLSVEKQMARNIKKNEYKLRLQLHMFVCVRLGD